MRKYLHATLIVFALLVTSGCKTSSVTYRADYDSSFRKTAKAIESLVQDPKYDNALWSVVVEELDSGDRLFSRLADLSLMPASNTKLYTTAAALEQLGPDFRYETAVFATGPVVGGVLEGDLVVRGSGDPTISGRFNDGDITRTFFDWADSLRSRGITTIQGNIVGDDNLFDDTLLGYGWSWDDEVYWYSAQLGALSFNDNCIDLTITPSLDGEAADISWEPANTNYVTIVNNATTVAAGESIRERYARERYSNVIQVSTEVPADTVEQESITVHNPTEFFVHVLRQSLESSGIMVDGYAIDVDDLADTLRYENASKLFAHRSPTLTEISHVINKRSQNLYADQVLKTLAVATPDDPAEIGTARAGLEAALRTFSRAGIEDEHHNLVDGSGLSRYNLFSAENTVRLLRYMAHHPKPDVFEAFYYTLPIGGVDGSLSSRFDNGPATNNVRAKTGTISNASTLSGYVTTASGQELIFSIVANNFLIPTSQVRKTQDDIVNLLAGMR